MRSIPIMDQTFSAGKGDFIPEKENILGYIAIPKELFGSSEEHLGACYVHGDSMYLTLHDGDLIIADNLGYDGQEGFIHSRDIFNAVPVSILKIVMGI